MPPLILMRIKPLVDFSFRFFLESDNATRKRSMDYYTIQKDMEEEKYT